MIGVEQVVRHPHQGWVPDRNQNASEKPLFGPDVTVVGVGVAPGPTSEPDSGTDSAVTEKADLYLPFGTGNGPHDEWTVRGRRWRQDGAGRDWRGLSGREFGTVVTVVRREG